MRGQRVACRARPARRDRPGALWLWWLLLLALGLPACTPRSDRPDVLLIVADDMGPHLSMLGTPGIRTPALDRLAARGVLFREAHAATASCAPSRGALLTGMMPHANGHWRNTRSPGMDAPESEFGRATRARDPVGVHEDLPTLVEQLDAAGYLTGITHKWHLSPPWKFPFARRLRGGRSAPAAAQEVLDFVREAGERPFFLMLNVQNTHRPFDRWLPHQLVAPVPPASVDVPPYFPDTPAVRQELADYYSAVQGVDEKVGAVLEALEGQPRERPLLVVFTADHGWPFVRGKATAYRAGTHVPLIVAGPGVRAAQLRDELVSLIDLAPTLLVSAGLEVPASVQGVSLWPLLRGRAGTGWRTLLFTEHNAHGPGEIYPTRAVFDGRFHYLRNGLPRLRYRLPSDLALQRPGGSGIVSAIESSPQDHPGRRMLAALYRRPSEELYDVGTDPWEQSNLARSPEAADTLRRLREALDARIAADADPVDPRLIERRVQADGGASE